MKDMFSKSDVLFLTSCMICGSENIELIGNKKTINKNSNIEFQIIKCANCHHWQTSPMPKQEFLNQLYKENSAHLLSEGWAEKTAHQNNEKITKLDSNWIVEYLGKVPVGNFLEIGSGNGALLRCMRELGWNAHGIDLGSYAQDLNVYSSHSELPKDLLFDCIVFQDVMEHVVNPVETLELYLKSLAPGALLFMAVPWSESKAAKIDKTNWNMVQPIAHLHYFSKNSAARVLSLNHFEILEVQTINTLYKSYLKSLFLNVLHLMTRLLRPWKWKVLHERVAGVTALLKLFPGDPLGDQLHVIAKKTN